MLYDEHNPFRPPQWRWETARWLRENGKFLRRHRTPDPYVKLARKYLDQRDRCQNERDLALLGCRMPGVHTAFLIFASAEDQDDRWTVEARVLAGERRERIADRQKTSVEVVFWYETLFFDVRQDLHRKDWLVNRVLGHAANRGIRARQYDLLLKLYALVGGPLVVDALVQKTSRLGRLPQTAEEVAAFWGEDYQDQTRRTAAVAARTVPIDSHTHAQIVDAHHRLLEMERAAAAAGGDQGKLIVANLSAALAAIPFRVADDPAALSGPAGAGRALELASGAELRAGELLEGGLDPSRPAPDLSAYQFPEVVRAQA